MMNFRDINFYITEDNSVGLFDKQLNEIFHSKSGAYKEADDKFVIPVINSGIKFEDEIKILDICFGIGYNSKCFINKFDNDVTVDAIEINKNLIIISPFLKDNINNDKLKLNLITELIKNTFNFNDLYNHILNTECKIINNYFSDFGLRFIQFLEFCHDKNILSEINHSNLHNIYYNYISDSMNERLKANKNNKVIINYHIDDARNVLKEINNLYDVVFLDGFSSKIDPALWTIDFLSCVKSKMKNNSILVSYSKATPFRSALTELGFKVGKTFLNNIDMGTVASLNSQYIINPMTEYDNKIISSRSGITYKDKDLNLSANEIINNRNIEITNSNRISRSQTDKLFK